MTTHMLKIWFWINIFIITFIPNIVCAGNIVLTGNIVGNKITWQNDTVPTFNNTISPSSWIISNSNAVFKWIPATYKSYNNSSLIFNNQASSESFSSTVRLDGIQYNLNNSLSYFTAQPVSGVSSSVCNVSNYGVITVLSDPNESSCMGSNEYVSNSKVTPFQFYRPLFEVNAITADIESANVSSGTYSAFVNITPFYYFQSDSGVWTYTDFSPQLVEIKINYQKSILNDIIVTGSGAITPNYDTTNMTVSGETTYNILATGHFSDGLNMTFGRTTNDYNLISSTDSTKIPYSISCSQCNIENIVTNGVFNNSLVLGETVSGENLGDVSAISLDFKISYDSVPSASISTGNYQDIFIVIFEENI